MSVKVLTKKLRADSRGSKSVLKQASKSEKNYDFHGIKNYIPSAQITDEEALEIINSEKLKNCAV